MRRHLAIAVLVLFVTTFATHRVSRADCGPGTDNVDNSITNNGACTDINGGNNTSTGTQTNTITNNGTVNAPYPDGNIFGGSNNSTGTQNNIITNSGSVNLYLTGGVNSSTGTQNITINNSSQVGLIQGGYNSDAGAQNITINNSGQAAINGGGNAYGVQTITINNTGTITQVTTIGGTGSSAGGKQTVIFTNSGTVNADLLGGINYNNSLSAPNTQNNTIILEPGSVVNGNVIGGINSNPNATQNNSIIIKDGAIVNGTIYGYQNTPSGNQTSTITFNQTITNQDEYDRLSAFIASAPPSGEITINGITYTYTNITQLVNLLIFKAGLSVRVTWFAPGDGRIDPRPGDHLAAYCDFKHQTISAIVIGTADSQGKMLTVFKLADVLKAGKGGLSAGLGSLGIVSIAGDAQGNFWLAWNGGVYGATGQGDFAKSFNCKFAQ